MSHPLRVRGLKHRKCQNRCRSPLVASFTGAWIETGSIECPVMLHHVASFTGAWIETYLRMSEITKHQGRILYGCVDWNTCYTTPEATTSRRILYGCVDWNKKHLTDYNKDIRSHPLRVRGLKPVYSPQTYPSKNSRILYGCVDWNQVVAGVAEGEGKSHPLRVRGLKHHYVPQLQSEFCRILYGCVDWNKSCVISLPCVIRRILYGCVDWNIM